MKKYSLNLLTICHATTTNKYISLEFCYNATGRILICENERNSYTFLNVLQRQMWKLVQTFIFAPLNLISNKKSSEPVPFSTTHRPHSKIYWWQHLVVGKGKLVRGWLTEFSEIFKENLSRLQKILTVFYQSLTLR